MWKSLKVAIPAVLLAALTLGVVSAYAQGDAPQGPRGRGGFMMHQLLAPYEEGIHQALADALGVSLTEFEAARAEGETLADLAAAHDVELAALVEVRDAARTEAIDQAVTDGVITQAQADWMLEHQAARQQARLGAGRCGEQGSAGRSSE